MRIQSVSCNHCGAPLDVSPKTRYATCAFCGSRLEIHRSGNAVYSEVLEQVAARTEQIADDVETIKLQNELERLDREWAMGREHYMIRGKNGEYNVPSSGGSIAGAVIAGLFGIFWITMAISTGAPWFFPCFGIFFILFAIFAAVFGSRKAGAYQSAQREYESRRRELLRQIQQNR